MNQVDIGKINQIVASYNLLQAMSIINGPISYIDGLSLFVDYVKCPECDNIYSRDSLRMHYSRSHSDMGNCKPNSLPGLFAQQLDQGANKKLFHVIPHSATPNDSFPSLSTDDVLQNFRTRRNNLILEYYPKDIDARAVSPWLLFTGWHIHIQPYKANQLCKLVSMPRGEGRLDKLSNAVQSLFKHAYHIITVTNTLVLQKLNTTDPIKYG